MEKNSSGEIFLLIKMTNLPPTLGKNRVSNYVGSDVVLKFRGKFLCRFDVVFALKTCRPEKNLLVTLSAAEH